MPDLDLRDLVPEVLNVAGGGWHAEYGLIAAAWDDAPPVPSALVVYGQRDERWADLIYAGGTTFAKAGCLVVSVAMMASLVCAEPVEPPEVARRLAEAGCFVGNLLNHPENIPLAFRGLTWDGALHYRDKAADMDRVAQEIAANGATIAEVAFNPLYKVTYKDANGETQWNQHFLVLTRVVGDDCEVADPWTGEVGLLCESRYRLDRWPKKASRIITGLRLVGVEGQG